MPRPRSRQRTRREQPRPDTAQAPRRERCLPRRRRSLRRHYARGPRLASSAERCQGKRRSQFLHLHRRRLFRLAVVSFRTDRLHPLLGRPLATRQLLRQNYLKQTRRSPHVVSLGHQGERAYDRQYRQEEQAIPPVPLHDRLRGCCPIVEPCPREQPTNSQPRNSARRVRSGGRLGSRGFPRSTYRRLPSRPNGFRRSGPSSSLFDRSCRPTASPRDGISTHLRMKRLFRR